MSRPFVQRIVPLPFCRDLCLPILSLGYHRHEWLVKGSGGRSRGSGVISRAECQSKSTSSSTALSPATATIHTSPYSASSTGERPSDTRIKAGDQRGSNRAITAESVDGVYHGSEILRGSSEHPTRASVYSHPSCSCRPSPTASDAHLAFTGWITGPVVVKPISVGVGGDDA